MPVLFSANTLSLPNTKQNNMLELRPNCENCNKALPYDSTEAMICSMESTFCETCVNEILKKVCPDCGGELCRRPARYIDIIEQYPASTKNVYKRVDSEKHKEFLNKRIVVPYVKAKLQY